MYSMTIYVIRSVIPRTLFCKYKREYAYAYKIYGAVCSLANMNNLVCSSA